MFSPRYICRVYPLHRRFSNPDWTRYFQLHSTFYLKEFSNLDEALTSNSAGVPVLRLDLSRQKIRVVPSELAQLSELKQLILDRTKIDALPSALSALKDLEYFSADRNQMTAFPEVILEWKQLRYLSLGDNLIDSIPLNIDVLDRMQTLNLWSNMLHWPGLQIARVY